MKQKLRRFFLFIAFCILILIVLSVDEVQGKKKRRHPLRREGKITRNEEQIERTKRRKAPKAKGMGPMSNMTQEGDEPWTTTNSSSTTRTEPSMEESIDTGNRKVTVDEQRVEKKASRQEKQLMRNKQYMKRTTESASNTNTSIKDETSSTSSESPKMPDERKEDPGRSLRDPPGVEVHRIDEEDYGRTLAPGIEPSPPGFVNEEEFARHTATLATTTTATTGITLVENIFAADIEGPRPLVGGQNDVDNDIFLVVTPTTNGKMGIDSNRFWKFTRVPYMHNNSGIVKQQEQMKEQWEKKSRKEEQHPAGENGRKNLPRGQIEIFVAKSEENAGEEKKSDTETTGGNCTKHRHQMMEAYAEKRTLPEDEKTETMQDSTTVMSTTTTTITATTGDSESKTTEMSPEGTTAGGTNLFISLLPDTAAQFDFDLDRSGNKTENAEKEDEQIKKGAQREPKMKNLEVVEDVTTEVSESETTQTMPLVPHDKEKNEGDCCALLRLLVGQKLNTTVGERSEFFAGTEDSTHPQADEANKAETGGMASSKVVERVEDEGRKDEETPSNSTVRAQWRIIESVTTTKSGLEILSEDLREENVKLIRNHPESNEPTPVTEMSTTVKSTTPETVVTHYTAHKGGQFPRSTTTLASTHKWTPYIFDCALESDERGERLCQEWAKGGLCEINRATQFLFCRRTCLCIGIRDETRRTRR